MESGYSEALTYGHGDADKFAFLERRPDAVDEIPEQDADDDCQQDPEHEESVQPSKTGIY